MPTILPFANSFEAYFLSPLFNAALLRGTVSAAESIYNSLPRKYGKRKQISVTVNSQKKCLEITLYSDTILSSINQLRASQYFSKVLSKQPGMGAYIIDKRLLRQ